MDGRLKTILSSILQTLLLLLVGGIGLFILLLVGSFGAFPLYVTQALMILGPAGLRALPASSPQSSAKSLKQ